jgi:predicted RecA/RadA family phage recombinase
MKNFLQPGDTLTLTAPSGGVVSGTPYLIGGLLVVALSTVAETLPFEGVRRGVFSFTKVGSQAWSEGDKVYWDNTNKYFTKTAADNTFAGYAVEAVGSGGGATTGKVLLLANGAVRSAHLADPTGGGTVDSQARATIGSILDALEAAGILAAT